MKRTTITLPDDLAELVDREALRRQTSFSGVVRQFILQGLSGAGEKPREISWAGLFHDPGMAPAEGLEEKLAADWADDLDRDRG
jgi:hypothetical protein